MKILISGYFNKGNFGDELIFDIFKKRFGFKFRYLKTRRNIFKILIACFSNDFLIFPGGGVFQQETGFFSFYYYIFLILIFILRRKKVFLINQGFGEMGAFEKFLIRFVFKKISFISVRDEESFKFLKKNGITSCFSADTCFYISDKVEKKEGDLVLVIPRGNKDLWLEIIRFFKDNLTGKILIIPFQKERDLVLCEKIKGLVGSGEIFLWENIEEVLELFKRAKFVFASCYHAVLLSILFRINFIAVYYNKKVKNLLNSFFLLDKMIFSEKDLKIDLIKKNMQKFEISNIIYKMKEREEKCFKEFLKCFHT